MYSNMYTVYRMHIYFMTKRPVALHFVNYITVGFLPALLVAISLAFFTTYSFYVLPAN